MATSGAFRKLLEKYRGGTGDAEFEPHNREPLGISTCHDKCEQLRTSLEYFVKWKGLPDGRARLGHESAQPEFAEWGVQVPAKTRRGRRMNLVGENVTPQIFSSNDSNIWCATGPLREYLVHFGLNGLELLEGPMDLG